MSRKDYQLIADVIRAEYIGGGSQASMRRLALAFADALADTSPGFDRERFLHACGVFDPQVKIVVPRRQEAVS